MGKGGVVGTGSRCGDVGRVGGLDVGGLEGWVVMLAEREKKAREQWGGRNEERKGEGQRGGRVAGRFI